MTPSELRAWRSTTGLSQGIIAALLGVDKATYWRWEKGLCPIPAIVRPALRGLDLSPLPSRQESAA